MKVAIVAAVCSFAVAFASPSAAQDVPGAIAQYVEQIPSNHGTAGSSSPSVLPASFMALAAVLALLLAAALAPRVVQTRRRV